MKVIQFKKYPADKPRRYNGCGEPCDMWTGPCCCGAWHNGKDHEEHLASDEDLAPRERLSKEPTR